MSQVLSSPSACCSPCDETVNVAVPGPQGEPGTNGSNGSNGQNAYTTLSAAFTQPAVGATASATVVSSAAFVIGEDAFLEGAGYEEVTAIADATHVTLRNRGYTANSAPATVIPIASRLAPSGEKGAAGAAGGGGDMLGANNLSDVVSAATSRTNLGGSVVGVNLFTVASPSAIRFLRVNADNTVTLLSDSAQRTALGLAIGTNVQAYDADLATWAGITPSANAQTFISAANNAAMRTALGVIADNYLLYQHQQASGVAGGDFASGAWRTVPITTEVSDVGGFGVLAANEVTLQPGTYRFRGWSNAYNVTNAQMRLWNDTAAAVVPDGGYGRCAVSSGASTQLLLVEGRFTIGVASEIRLEAQCSVTALANGFGLALSFGGTEVYAGLEFIKE